MFFANNTTASNIAANTLTQQAQTDKRDRDKRIKNAWDKFFGRWANPLLPTTLDPNGDDNTKVNYARRTVNISAFYLFGTGIEWQVGDAADDPETKYLEECWEAQAGGKDGFLLEMAQGGGVAGDVFLRLYKPDKANGDEYPRIVALDAQTVTVESDPADYNRVNAYVIEFNSVDRTGKAVYHKHVISRRMNQWEIVEYEKNGGAERETRREIWPHPFAPVFHCKNQPLAHSFYGLSDIEEDTLRINHAVNVVLSNINRILRAHAHPLQYATTGARLDGIKRDVGNLLIIPDAEATVGSLEMLSDLTSSDEQFRRLTEAYHQLTEIPEVVTGKMENVGQLSGLALKILYNPLVMLTTGKRAMYGPMLRKVCRALLILGGKKEVAESEITLKWPEIIPQSDLEDAQTAGLWQDAGVSRETMLERNGFNAAEEAEKKGKEADADLERQRNAFDRGNVGGANPYGQGGNNTGGE